MPLRLSSEIVVDRFLPTARSMLARALADRGLTQQAIADRLGVTQAAVSGYLDDGEAGDDRLRGPPDAPDRRAHRQRLRRRQPR